MFFFVGLAGLFGLSVGSFLNVVIYRLGLNDDSNPPPFDGKEGVAVLGVKQNVRKPSLRGDPSMSRYDEAISPNRSATEIASLLSVARNDKKGVFLGLSILFGRSYCPYCKTELKWYELFPVLSFIIQRRKCNSCGSPISWQYPLVELGTAVVFVLIMLQYLNGDISFL